MVAEASKSTTSVKLRNAKALGAAIRAERRRQGYTQVQTAQLCGVGVTFLSDLENGKPTAELGKALHVVQMLGMDLYAVKRGEAHAF